MQVGPLETRALNGNVAACVRLGDRRPSRVRARANALYRTSVRLDRIPRAHRLRIFRSHAAARKLVVRVDLAVAAAAFAGAGARCTVASDPPDGAPLFAQTAKLDRRSRNRGDRSLVE